MGGKGKERGHKGPESIFHFNKKIDREIHPLLPSFSPWKTDVSKLYAYNECEHSVNCHEKTNIHSIVYLIAENVISMVQKSVPLIFAHYVPYKYEKMGFKDIVSRLIEMWPLCRSNIWSY